MEQRHWGNYACGEKHPEVAEISENQEPPRDAGLFATYQ